MLNVYYADLTGKTLYIVVTQASNDDQGVGVLSYYDTTILSMLPTTDAAFVWANCAMNMTEDAVVVGKYLASINPNISGTFQIFVYEQLGATPDSNDLILGTVTVYYEYSDTIEGGTERFAIQQTLDAENNIVTTVNDGVLTAFESRQLNAIYNKVLTDNRNSGL